MTKGYAIVDGEKIYFDEPFKETPDKADFEEQLRGAVLDRDQNAALNIERQALKMFAGVGSRRTETHVERMSDSSEQSASKRENMAEERRPSKPCQFGTVW